MDEIIKFLSEHKLLTTKISRYTLLVNEDRISQGVLIFVPHKDKDTKVVIPAPFHEILFNDDDLPTYQQVLTNKHALLLR